MQNMIAKKSKRIRAFLLCSLVLFSLLSSFAYVGLLSDHQCTHVHCDVCEHLAFLSLLIRSAVFLFALSSVLSGIVYKASEGIHTSRTVLSIRTPVACKVRLNN